MVQHIKISHDDLETIREALVDAARSAEDTCDFLRAHGIASQDVIEREVAERRAIRFVCLASRLKAVSDHSQFDG